MPEEVTNPEEALSRMDFITVQTKDKGTKVEDGEERYAFAAQMKPNPDRYDRVDEDDRKGWLDTMDNVFFPDEVMSEAWENADGLPIYYSPPDIDDFGTYKQERRRALEQRLESGNVAYNFANESTKVLKDLAQRDNPMFVIMVVDLVGSTNMNAQMHPTAYSALVHSFIQETHLLVNKHRGFVLKYTGDGLIAYFPEPNITGKHDNAILCASRLRGLVSDVLNPAYSDMGLPQVKWRVGIDTGSPDIFPGAQGTRDLLGTAVSMAAKIESTAETNEILIGEYTERNLHTNWRKSTVEVTEDRDWEYTRDGEEYGIHKLLQ